VCSGQSISVCVAGQRTTVDCSAFGAQCRGSNVTQTAHCG
jgi:hypothetical protein